MRKGVSFCLILLMAFSQALVEADGWTQPQETPPGQEQAGTLHIDVRRVLVRVLAQDKRTHEAVRGLSKSNFELRDGGTPKALTYFAAEPGADRPMTIVLLLDLRVLDRKRLPGFAETLKPALEQLASSDRIALWFLDQSHFGEVQEATNDHALIETGIDKIEQAWKKSPSFGAAPASSLEAILKRYGSPSPSSELEIVMVTNDLDAASSNRVETLRKSLLTAPGSLDILYKAGKSDRFWRSLSSVAAPGGFSPTVPGQHYEFLSYLQKQSGGKFIEVQSENYGAAFLQMFKDLSAAYWLEFAPDASSPAGKLHSISLRIRPGSLPKQSSVKLIYRTGYYLPAAETGPDESVKDRAP